MLDQLDNLAPPREQEDSLIFYFRQEARDLVPYLQQMHGRLSLEQAGGEPVSPDGVPCLDDTVSSTWNVLSNGSEVGKYTVVTRRRLFPLDPPIIVEQFFKLPDGRILHYNQDLGRRDGNLDIPFP